MADETSKEFNDSIPEPGSSQESGRVAQKIPKSLHARLATRAKQEGMSMNALVAVIISESLGKNAHQQTTTHLIKALKQINTKYHTTSA